LALQFLKYNPRFSALADIIKYFSRYTINRLTNKIISLGNNSIYVVLPNFITNFIK
ncbi:hypothetical protein NEUTE2DRAFT_49159, partial [Neurospora tetrasperma FGSC 2509]